MFNDSVSFNGGTRYEVITVLANCGRDTDRARRALVTWIRHKQDKGRSTEHILAKLRDIESKFIRDASLHNAFRDARAETFLPRPPDLPLPASLRRPSGSHMIPDPPSPSALRHSRPSSMPSSIAELSEDLLPHATPRSPSTHSSRGSSQMSVLSSGNSRSNSSRPASHPHPVPRIPELRSPPIQIPRSLCPGPSSPVTSSPEDSGISLRYHHLSDPTGPPPSHASVPPQSASSLESSVSFRRQYSDPRGYAFHDMAWMQTQISQSKPPRRGIPQSPGTSSSEEFDFRPGHHPMARTMGYMSPGRSRVTPPRTGPPDQPLPPIPSDDQGVDSDDGASNKSVQMEQPPTPVRSYASQASTPARPLPIQPIPSPIPGSDEWEHDGSSLQQSWHNPSGELSLMREVARQDSPVYEFNQDRASHPPPPYATQLDAHSPPDVPAIGDMLDRAVSVCGGSQDVRREVSKCIQFLRGYEPPYWQTRLQACGLNAEAAKYLVDAMSKQVDWATSFNRVTG